MIKKLAFAVSLALVMVSLSACWETARGEKRGILVKGAKEGFFVSTNEYELVRGGMTNGSGAFGVTPFDFTIEDEVVNEIAKTALESQSEIIVFYHREKYAAPWRTHNPANYFADKIKIIENK